MAFRMPISTSGSERIPYKDAESLLWGPELNKRFQCLLEQFRKLQEEHDVGKTRMQSFEAIAEAAEAIIERLNGLDKKVADLEAVGNQDDKWKTWAENEMERLRGKCEAVQEVKESVEASRKELGRVGTMSRKIDDTSTRLEDVLTELRELRQERQKDQESIRALKEEVERLKNTRLIPDSQPNYGSHGSFAMEDSILKPPLLPPPPPLTQYAQQDLYGDISETEDEEPASPTWKRYRSMSQESQGSISSTR